MAEENPTNNQANKRIKVLLLEDEPHLMEVYSQRLRGDAFDVSTENDEVEGMDLALKVKPDVIILDISLPMEEDFGFIPEMKKHPEIADTPVVILTDLYDEEDVKKGKAFGAADYLIRSEMAFSEVVERVKKAAKKPA